MTETSRRWDTLDRLFATIEARKGADPKTSHTAKLFDKGRLKIAQKLGEEAMETALAAVAEGDGALVNESADLLYHWLVLLADAGIDPQQVLDALAQREGLSGVAEKASRTD